VRDAIFFEEELMAVQEVRSHESKIYYEFSKFYERIFTGLLGPRIRSTIDALKIRPGAKILEVGVGTGLSLSAYPPNVEVTGIDLAAEMLDQAQQKVDQNQWRHIRLRQMDALHMDFPDSHFDYVMAFHILSVVADSDRLMGEILRVCKPRGTVAIINHFRSEHRWLAPLVDILDPVTRRLGWRTTLRFSDVVAGEPLHVEQRFKTSLGSLFTVVVATKTSKVDLCPLPPAVINRTLLPKRRLIPARLGEREDENDDGLLVGSPAARPRSSARQPRDGSRVRR
jgi:phosphatidylethanolamine/phosphatidyl-N-methylethanolamine N-methyltransferase